MVLDHRCGNHRWPHWVRQRPLTVTMQLTRTATLSARFRRTFPRPTSDGVWQISDKADNLDEPKMHHLARRPRSYPISVQSIIGATSSRHDSGFSALPENFGGWFSTIIPKCSRQLPYVPADFGCYCTNGVPKFPVIAQFKLPFFV